MLELTSTTFEDTIKSPTLTVIDFMATWCMPCKIYAPVIEEVAAEMDGKVIFAKLDIDQNESLAQSYAIASVPTLLVFQNGELKDRLIGVKKKDDLKSILEQML